MVFFSSCFFFGDGATWLGERCPAPPCLPLAEADAAQSSTADNNANDDTNENDEHLAVKSCCDNHLDEDPLTSVNWW